MVEKSYSRYRDGANTLSELAFASVVMLLNYSLSQPRNIAFDTLRAKSRRALLVRVSASVADQAVSMGLNAFAIGRLVLLPSAIGKDGHAAQPHLPPPVSCISRVNPLYSVAGHDEVTPSDLTSEERQAGNVVQAIRPSIVHVHQRNSYMFSSQDDESTAPGSSTGMIWDAKGHVIVPASIVRGVSECKVTLADCSTYTAKVVGSDYISDLAVLKIGMPKSKLPTLVPITMTSTPTTIGQRLFGLSNPFGLNLILSSGVCGGILANDHIRISSSSPLPLGSIITDRHGHLVGLSTGTNRATPIDYARGILDQIILFNRAMRPALGCGIATGQLLQSLGVVGALVLDVPSDSPAAIAGLRPTHRDIFGELILGDIIITCEGRAVVGAIDLIKVLDDRRAGDRIKVEIIRDGKQMVLTCVLSERKIEWKGL